MTQEEQYKSFIKYCTKAGKSISNYSDFKRINETIAKIKGVEKYDIYSCVHTKELQDMIDILYENEEFKAYNTKGGNQYSNALETYLKFLHAKEIFAEETKPKYSPILSLQQIYYGAPGTGKSKAIKDLTFGESVIRTTFHPDSDYASFVGTYKPSTEDVVLRDCYGKKVIDDETKEVVKEERIAYKFIPQAFLEAYVEAWKKLGSGKKQYLIIEEINRGNCAQIFGDLFQLLDRNEYGFSDYPIVADKDMQKYLASGDDITVGMVSGWQESRRDLGNFEGFGECEVVKSGKTLTAAQTVNYEKRPLVLTYVFNYNSMEVTDVTVDQVYTTGEKMSKAGLNTLICIVTVFVVLIVICLVIYAFRIIPFLEKKFRKEKEVPADGAQKAVEQIEKMEEKKDDLELVAVIAAAIAAATGTSTDDFVVRSIKRRR